LPHDALSWKVHLIDGTTLNYLEIGIEVKGVALLHKKIVLLIMTKNIFVVSNFRHVETNCSMGLKDRKLISHHRVFETCCQVAWPRKTTTISNLSLSCIAKPVAPLAQMEESRKNLGHKF
jgi:hypothetical protein